MGERHRKEAEFLARRRRRLWQFSLAAILPFVVFVAILSIVPASLGWRPLGGSISIAIYLAVILFAWPVIIGAIYITVADREAP